MKISDLPEDLLERIRKAGSEKRRIMIATYLKEKKDHYYTSLLELEEIAETVETLEASLTEAEHNILMKPAAAQDYLDQGYPTIDPAQVANEARGDAQSTSYQLERTLGQFALYALGIPELAIKASEIHGIRTLSDTTIVKILAEEIPRLKETYINNLVDKILEK